MDCQCNPYSSLVAYRFGEFMDMAIFGQKSVTGIQSMNIIEFRICLLLEITCFVVIFHDRSEILKREGE